MALLVTLRARVLEAVMNLMALLVTLRARVLEAVHGLMAQLVPTVVQSPVHGNIIMKICMFW